jgi:pimeloyl-[acyl-carrier protein] methyl ester esterase
VPTATTDDGIALAFAAVGEGPPDVLCMHGWAGSGRYFDATLEHLDLARVRVATFDLRGHRGSGPADDDYGLDRIAADALAVADAAGLDEFVVLGFSMSGKFAQYLSLAAPGRVIGQILVAGSPAGEIPLPTEVVEDWLGRQGDPVRLAAVTEPYVTQPIAPELMQRFGEDAATVSPAALAATLDAVCATSFADRVGEIAAPTLVIGGSGDPMFPPEALRAGVVAQLPRARLALVDAGHEIPLECPRELAALIEAFLAALG